MRLASFITSHTLLPDRTCIWCRSMSSRAPIRLFVWQRGGSGIPTAQYLSLNCSWSSTCCKRTSPAVLWLIRFIQSSGAVRYRNGCSFALSDKPSDLSHYKTRTSRDKRMRRYLIGKWVESYDIRVSLIIARLSWLHLSKGTIWKYVSP